MSTRMHPSLSTTQFTSSCQIAKANGGGASGRLLIAGGSGCALTGAYSLGNSNVPHYLLRSGLREDGSVKLVATARVSPYIQTETSILPRLLAHGGLGLSIWNGDALQNGQQLPLCLLKVNTQKRMQEKGTNISYLALQIVQDEKETADQHLFLGVHQLVLASYSRVFRQHLQSQQSAATSIPPTITIEGIPFKAVNSIRLLVLSQ